MSKARSRSRGKRGKSPAQLGAPLKMAPMTRKSPNRKDRRVIAVFYVCAVVAVSIVAYCFVCVFPPLSSVGACSELLENGMAHLLRNAGESDVLKGAYDCGRGYGEKHQEYLAYGFVMLYITLQSFVIPGTGILSVLSGALFPFFQAEVMVAMCASCGATVSFLISRTFGSAFITYFGLAERLAGLRTEIEKAGTGAKLFVFLTAMRSTPVPNLLINVGTPHLGVPVLTFFLSTLFGLVPLNTCHILSGKALSTVGKLDRGPLTAIFGVGSLLCVAMFFWYQRKKCEQKGKGSRGKGE